MADDAVVTPPKPLDARQMSNAELIANLREWANTPRLGHFPLLLREAADALAHLAAGATPAAQDAKPLEALERIELQRHWIGNQAAYDEFRADLALLRAALVRGEESERDEARAARAQAEAKLKIAVEALSWYAESDRSFAVGLGNRARAAITAIRDTALAKDGKREGE